LPPLVAYMEGLYDCADHSVRSRLMTFAKDRGIRI
jgi:hypothetical protein